MINRENFGEVLKVLGFTQDITGTACERNINGCLMKADFAAGRLIYPEQIRGREHNTSFTAPENFVVFECVHRLIEKGYRPEDIELEKEWRLGRTQKGGRADICVYDKDSDNVLMIIECKTFGNEYNKAFRDTKTDGGQLFSYWQQEISAQWLVLYTSNIADGAVTYKSPTVNCSDDKNLKEHSKKRPASDKDDSIRLYENAHTAEEKFTVWKETYNCDFHDGIIFSEDSAAYDIGIKPLRKKDLKPFTYDDKKGIVNAFEEILRHNNVSDKENAFNRLIALFICKLVDEYMKGDDDELAFQYVPRRDTYEDLQDRLQQLYHEGMQKFMMEEITYVPANYPEQLFLNYTGQKRKEAIRELSETFRKLKYFTNNDFAFKDVHNEKLFYQNGKILVEVVQLFERYRIVKSGSNDDSRQGKEQLLGDLFEQLLDRGFKQNEGQFFTPIPITRFIWDCLPLKRFETRPKIIDYACGAGHFLTEAVEAVNHFIPNPDGNNSWTRDCIFGIEKDYRLARVSKVSMFMNGAGESNIIFGDGLEDSEQIKPASFDILTANPPYSVASFKQYTKLTGREFALLEKLSPNSSEIEVLFVERIGQLLTDGGIAAVILPSSILSNDSASYTGAREEILRNFKIRAIVKLGSNTFGATGTNTVIMFLERYHRRPARTSHVQDSVQAIFADGNLDGWEDRNILSGYLAMQGLTREQWSDFLHERLELETMPEYFRVYLEAFGREEFYREAKDVERKKVFYYGLTYSQRTVIILSPSDNAGQKEFLGYYWSNRKGDEGIQYVGERGGKLYVNTDREAEGTLADVVRRSFGDDYVRMTEDNSRYARVIGTSGMLDFSRSVFNISIQLEKHKKVELHSKYTMHKLGSVCKILIGGTPSRYKREYFSGTNLWVSIAEMCGQVINDTKEKITDDAVKNSNVKLIPKGTTLLSFKLSIGKTAIAGKDLYTNEAIAALIPQDKNTLLDAYIFYLFNTGIINLTNVGDKVFGKSLNSNYLNEQVMIPLPPVNIQREIVSECEEVDAQESSLNAEISSCREKIDALFGELEYRMGECSLSTVLTYVTERIVTDNITPAQYVTTDTMLQNCEGIRKYDKDLPSGSVIRFHKGDILLSNIRPYLRKLWFADFDGGCSPDVLVFRSKNEDFYSGRYIFYAMRRNKFFDFVMQDVNGIKMPRGNKEHIMRYKIPAPSQVQQKKFLDAVTELEAEISKAAANLKGLAGKKEEILKKHLRSQ